MSRSEQRLPSARSLLPELAPDPVAAVRAGLLYHTLRRQRTAGMLTPDASDRLLVLAEVVTHAHRALDSSAAAREWLRAPHSMLAGETPLDRLDS